MHEKDRSGRRTSLKSNQRIWVPIANAARLRGAPEVSPPCAWTPNGGTHTGSSAKSVPGTLAPLGTMMPGTTGAMRAAQAGETLSPSRPHPIVSARQWNVSRPRCSPTALWRRTDEAETGSGVGEVRVDLVRVHVVGNVLDDLVGLGADLVGGKVDVSYRVAT